MSRMMPFRRSPVMLSLAGAAAIATPCFAVVHSLYRQTNLVSDGSTDAHRNDSDLVNAWGLAFNPDGVWWVNDNHSGLSTLYDASGSKQSLVVTVPGPGGAQGSPTGIVFNNTLDFVVSDGSDSGPAAFIFAGEDGTISAWAPNVPEPIPATVAHVVVDNSGSGAIYKGLAMVRVAQGSFLYATDFHNNRIDVFDGEFEPVTLPPSAFRDPQIPSGFAPFGIANIDNRLYVTYARQDDDAEDDVAGKHLGFVDVFDHRGHLLTRLIKRNKLNAPWGLAKAPADFGEFSNMLLVGNFGDGRINAYNPATGEFKGTLRSASGDPIVIDGLWGLAFGNGGDAGPTNTLFFTAGPNDEEGGLFGSIRLGQH